MSKCHVETGYYVAKNVVLVGSNLVYRQVIDAMLLNLPTVC